MAAKKVFDIAQHLAFLASEIYKEQAGEDKPDKDYQRATAEEIFQTISEWVELTGESMDDSDWELEIPYTVQTLGKRKMRITVLIKSLD